MMRVLRVLLASLALYSCPSAFAVDPLIDISQYAHTKWTVEDGSLRTRVQAIAQTPDGYLWLGTEDGLVRFDGVQFVRWDPPKGKVLLGRYIYRLLVSRDGRLWIATDKGLAIWNGTSLSYLPELAGERVVALAEDHEGTLWVGSYKPTAQLCAVQGERIQCFGGTDRFGLGVDSLYADNESNLWASSQAGLWRWMPGPPKSYRAPIAEDMITDENGHLLLARGLGILRLAGENAAAYPAPPDGKPMRAVRMFRDREGALWIGRIGYGLVRSYHGRMDEFGRTDGLSGDVVTSLFEDQEGDLWVATLDGLDRFRDVAVTRLSVKQGLPTDARLVLGAKDGSIWLGTRDEFGNWNHGRLTASRSVDGAPAGVISSVLQDSIGRIWATTDEAIGKFERGLFAPVQGAPGGFVYAMSGDNTDGIWISTDRGLLHAPAGKAFERIPWARLSREDWAMAMLQDRVRGGIWMGFWRGGIVYYRDGQVRELYGEANGLGRGVVNSFGLDNDGTLWAATEGGLSRVKDGQITTLTAANGLPCDTVHWAMEDDDHFYWLYMACGLVRVAHRELSAWITDPKHIVQTRVFDGSDGVRIHSQRPSGNSPQVSKAADGRLWFVSGGGVSVIDPHHIPLNNLPPPVHVERILSNHEVRWQNLSASAAPKLRLAALSRDIQIDYTALSLVAPEKIRFKYKLEGYDRDWQDAGSRRQAFYTVLSPRNYRFHVVASNNSGVWNETGDTLEFSIAPAYYETNWFAVLVGSSILAAAWGLYRLRLYQVSREINIGLEHRVIERTRIARELHDTLLQSFQGLMLCLQAVDDLMPDGKAKDQLQRALKRADQAIAEGRSAVYDLRSISTTPNELAHAIEALGDELSVQHSATFSMVVEGSAAELKPIVRDEIYRVAREALRNAFKHATGRRIELELTYGERELRMRIRDDGVGIDAEILEEGRAGHYGLLGMHERAKEIGGKLDIWSRPGIGTEIDLSIANEVAYQGVRRP